ncbi:MAG: UDP-2,3-diacylglucosamine diphosphatase [Fibrobacter sp.]|jgi:UDP-2,3-diacylglucosamine hydrolase|uniref:UDP-2,3-diacylglucosamine diphosphatase n=1 Tax=Fibrobacter sp. UWP2 TaxID=1896216 RepID=UPI00091952EB|nr:UDP-2,3-diacylglucosamine diphosphatase [Fibrobacter sp. UWP2]MBO7383882.1 UDP-2,3-diacylglucosamine diphosphatase [Fibrobacter sp.]SHI36763.1 UDP-2,3-diacylglucosamine hydrolase [Fibrobacter sp. UWP2]
MSLPAYFICDAHLGIDPPGCVPDREAKLVRLLESWKGAASHVVIVGDLFEFWYEYSFYVASEHMELMRVLAELVKSGVAVHLLQGNHDFAYGDFFPKKLGVPVHKELMLEIQGKRVYFRHGDGVPKSDRGYRFLRKVLDFPLNRWLFSQIHPDTGMKIARFVGRNSRKYGENCQIKLEEYLDWGDSVLVREKCDYCIHGHHHIAGIWSTEHGTVASPGEWIKKSTFLAMEEGGLKLVSL